MLRSLRVALLASSAAVLVVGSSGVARAEPSAGVAAPAQPFCSVGLHDGRELPVTIPANAPALLFQDFSTNGAVASAFAELVSPSERMKLAAPTRDANEVAILALPSGLSGSYTIELGAECRSAPAPQLRQYPILVGPAVELPKAVGTLGVRTTNPESVMSMITLQPSEGMRAFLPVSVLDLTVDGIAMGSLANRDPNEILFTVNATDVCVENGALHREERVRKVSMGARIAGIAERVPAATMDLTIDCGAIKWTTGTPTQGANPSDDDAAAAIPAGSSEGGCSTTGAPGGATSSTAALAVMALATVAVMRRRRRAS